MAPCSRWLPALAMLVCFVAPCQEDESRGDRRISHLAAFLADCNRAQHRFGFADVSADGNLVALYSSEHGLLAYNLQSGKQQYQAELESGVSALACSSDGNAVAVGFESGKILCLQFANPQAHTFLLNERDARASRSIRALEFVNEEEIIVADRSKTVTCWTISNRKAIRAWQIELQPHFITASLHQGTYLVAGDFLRQPTLLGPNLPSRLATHRGQITSLRSSNRKDSLAVGDATGAIKIYSCQEFPDNPKEVTVSQRDIVGIRYSPDTLYIAALDGKGYCRCINSKTGDLRFPADVIEPDPLAAFFGYAAGGLLLRIGRRVEFFDPVSGKLLANPIAR